MTMNAPKLTVSEAIAQSISSGEDVTIEYSHAALAALEAMCTFSDAIEGTCEDPDCGETHSALGFEGAGWYVILVGEPQVQEPRFPPLTIN
jgi:hypothetical protein